MEFTFEKDRVWSADENGVLTAEAILEYVNGEADIVHTYVHPRLRGQGVASELMAAVALFLKEQGLKTTASCSYAHLWLARNRKEYADIISSGLGEQNISCRTDKKR